MTARRSLLFVVPAVGCAVAAVLYAYLSGGPGKGTVFGLEMASGAAAIGIGAGILYLTLPLAIRHAEGSTGGVQIFLLAGLLAGLFARLVLFGSDPILENDYLRYLWDGAVLAHGENPYRWSPAEILSGAAPAVLQQLAGDSAGLVERIGYADLRTIYPPVGIALFSLAHVADPWGLTGLRCLYLLADIATLVLLIVLLRRFRRSPLWVFVYWLNPLAAQMIYNAAHMDGLLVPFLLGAVLLAIRQWPLGASVILVLAAGIKLWPVLLAPLLFRHAAPATGRYVGAMLLFAAGFALLLLPFWLSGPAETSGLVAFGSEWRKNEVVFGSLVSAFDGLLTAFDVLRFDPERLARLTVGAGLVALAFWPVGPPDDAALVRRCLVIVASLFILAPAPYPWYFIWLLPFLTLAPMTAILTWTATLPLYQLRFHPYFESHEELFTNGIVWLEHGVPVVLIAATLLLGRVRR